MARDRKRTRARRERPKTGQPAPGGDVAAAEGSLHRADVPAALDHASAEVDEFDAALVRGAGGVALQPAPAEETAEEKELAQPVERAERREPRRSLPARAIAFLRASWAELQRVQWPDRPQVSQATAVVLGFVAVAGVYLGAADWVATKIVNFIL
jgi:preprotein translocase subunit SecE